ncbi:hypothetical protein [Gracilibacillus salinarum]|uniref:DUF4181 domain-containing protein n=1 Tax=Gracilibacillus salinarum TaxID=2932255 RepID=A0ABY4GSX0_9BACI|nr:hypothetical protein [Gracilibacillus salinarum]UOQ87379.1 hypothetical protein MUN87_11025 [Gracilibacillus salinarum]
MMKGDKMGVDNGKAIKFGYYAIVATLLTGAGIMIFDNHYYNDSISILLIFAAYIFQGFYDLYRSLKDGTKKWTFFHILYILFAISVLVWGITKVF